MTGTTGPVNPRRTYDASRRRARAEENRHRVLDVAERRFLADGYTATTLAAVATDAGVSVESIHKSFGGKAGIVRALWERGLRGAGPVPAEDRSDALRAREPDARRLIEGRSRFIAQRAPRGSPLLLLVKAASVSDAEIAALLDEIERARLTRMATNARRLLATGQVRDGLTVAHVRDVMWLHTSAEQYELLVLRRKWPIERYVRFVSDSMIGALLDPSPQRRPRRRAQQP
jgi:AcrR family transcriptional regulator